VWSRSRSYDTVLELLVEKRMEPEIETSVEHELQKWME
jgi:hypothetical protein